MTRPPDYRTSLRYWPSIIIPIRCDHCRRGRDVRLAVLAHLYGPDIDMEAIIQTWYRYCPRDPRRRHVKPQKYGLKCTAYIDMHFLDRERTT